MFMSQDNENVIDAVRLTKTFRDFWLREKVTAVSELDLQIRPREVFGLLGPNGSGKSTTIKMILGLLFPTRGWVKVFGESPTDVAIKKRIGFLPEESYLYPFLDARETLDFYGRLFHQPRRERHRRIDMLLDMVGLKSVAYRRVGEYSKGMQRRIGLAQALINDPDLLILDEPTSGMDPIGARQFKDLIRTLAARGKTIVLSSHLLTDVEDVCDRICILYGGRQRALGTINDLLAQHKFMQLTTDRLPDDLLEKVRQLLEESDKGLLEVTTPKDRLEALFLRIVKEAQEQRLVTGGAMVGGEVAEFLRGTPEERDTIEQLVQAGRLRDLQEHPEELAAVPLVPPPATEVLHDLMTEKKSAGKPVGDGASSSNSGKPQEADRSVIDDLVNPKDRRKKESS
jgi:ABC-2 type transport system ATP-binding protein